MNANCLTAFEEALSELKLEDPATLLVAKRIIALAQQGERDPIRLRDAGLSGPWLDYAD